MEGIITRDLELYRVEVYCDTKIGLDRSVLSGQKRASAKHTEETFKKLKACLSDKLPVALRGNKLPPTQEQLALRAAGVIESRTGENPLVRKRGKISTR